MKKIDILKYAACIIAGACAMYTVEETYDMLIEKANEKKCGGLTKYEYATWIVGKFTVSYTIGIFVASILIAIITNNKGGIKFVINTR